MSPAGSHAKCVRCGMARHRGVRFPYCGDCFKSYYKPILEQRRLEMKQRKADRLSRANRNLISEVDLKEPQMLPEVAIAMIGDAIVERYTDPLVPSFEVLAANADQRVQSAPVEEQAAPDMTQTRPMGRPPKRALDAATKAEIAEAYRLGESTTEISRTYQIGQGALYKIVREHGLELRGRGNGPSRPAEQPTLPGTPEPTGYHWQIHYEVKRVESVTVTAADFISAAAQVEAEGIVITQVRRLD